MHHDAECKVLQMYFIQKTIEPSHTFCNNIHTYFEIQYTLSLPLETMTTHHFSSVPLITLSW